MSISTEFWAKCEACGSREKVADPDNYPDGWAFLTYCKDGAGEKEHTLDICSKCMADVENILVPVRAE